MSGDITFVFGHNVKSDPQRRIDAFVMLIQDPSGHSRYCSNTNLEKDSRAFCCFYVHQYPMESQQKRNCTF